MSTPPHSSTAPAAVTVLGLGRMGGALAAAFLAAGHPTTVWNRSPGKADALVVRGARRAGSVAEAVAAARSWWSASPTTRPCTSSSTRWRAPSPAAPW
ncbi:NAD(P)-binding domain-containing protein [Actinomadura keratinilytica]